MKNILLLLSITLFGNANAQTYQKLLADSITEFDIINNYIPIRLGNPNQTLNSCYYSYAGIYFAKTDTLYKGKNYKKIGQSFSSSADGLIREDTVLRTVYFIPSCDSVEVLLYNFSLSQGDTISYNFPNSFFGAMHSGIFTVDSIRVKHDYQSSYHKHFYLRNHVMQDSTLELIEGVGSVNHPLFLYAGFGPGALGWVWSSNCTSTNFDLILSCKTNNGRRIYYDSCAYSAAVSQGSCYNTADTCNYYNMCGSVGQNNHMKNINVSPNPTSDQFFIEANTTDKLIIDLYDVNGRHVFNTIVSDKSNINVATLDNGAYTLTIKTEDRVINKKLVILR